MQAVSYRNVKLTGGFLKEKQDLNSRATINAVYDRFYETGRVGAFACRWTPDSKGIPKPHIFWDSDVAKWMEGASYILAKEDRPDLEEKIEKIIDDIEKSQWPDGYVNSYYTAVEPDRRFTERGNHELYCCGHLIEAAIAYYEATGRDRFLSIMRRYADLIEKVFMKENSAAFVTPGHEEIELALVKLWKCTGCDRYLRLARFFLDMRGRNGKDAPMAAAQDAPVAEQRTATGHAVRAAYLYSAMADVGIAEKDERLLDACRAIYEDIVNGKMYITGGTGSTHQNESFTIPYDLEPQKAYAETCAAIGMVFFSHRMLQADGKSDYADTIERELYNGMLSGLSLDGGAFFYENPLEISLPDRKRLAGIGQEHLTETQRVSLFGCSCCPPNLNRILAQLGEYIFGQDGTDICVHQYTGAEMESGNVKVKVETDYPVSGSVRVTQTGASRLRLRIPGWCRSFTLDCPYRMENGYAVIDSPAEKINLTLAMDAQAVFPNPAVRALKGCVAVQKGPVVYCLESGDNGKKLPYQLRVKLPLEAAEQPGIAGLPDLVIRGRELECSGPLYSGTRPESRERMLRMIPYFAFANRGEDSMAVWLAAAEE